VTELARHSSENTLSQVSAEVFLTTGDGEGELCECARARARAQYRKPSLAAAGSSRPSRRYICICARGCSPLALPGGSGELSRLVLLPSPLRVHNGPATFLRSESQDQHTMASQYTATTEMLSQLACTSQENR
jgi:hypothetical protein